MAALTPIFTLKQVHEVGERDDRGLRERVEMQKQKYAKDRGRLLCCTSADTKRHENNLKSAFLRENERWS